MWAISLWGEGRFRFWLFPLLIVALFAPPLSLFVPTLRRSVRNHPTAFIFAYIILVQISRLLLPFKQTTTGNVIIFGSAFVFTFVSLMVWQWARWGKEIDALLEELGQFLPKDALKRDIKYVVLEGRSIRVLLVLAAWALTAVFFIIDLAFVLDSDKLGNLAAIITIPLTLSVAGTVPFYLEIGKRINDRSDKTDENLIGLRDALLEFDRNCEPLWQFYKSSIGSEWAPLFQQWLYESELEEKKTISGSNPSIRETLQMEIEVLARSMMLRIKLSQPTDIKETEKAFAISERDIDTLSYLLAADIVTSELEANPYSPEGTNVFEEPGKKDFEDLLVRDDNFKSEGDKYLISRRLGNWLDNHTLCRLEAEKGKDTYPKQKSTRIRLATDLRTATVAREQNIDAVRAQFIEVSYMWIQKLSRHSRVEGCSTCEQIYNELFTLVSNEDEREELQSKYRNLLLVLGTGKKRDFRLPTQSQLERISAVVSDLSGQSESERTENDSIRLISENSSSSTTLADFVIRAMSWGDQEKVEFNFSALLEKLRKLEGEERAKQAKKLYVKGLELHLRGGGSTKEVDELCTEIRKFYSQNSQNSQNTQKIVAVLNEAAKSNELMNSLKQEIGACFDRLMNKSGGSLSPSQIDEINDFRNAWNSHIDRYLSYFKDSQNSRYHTWLSPTDEEIHWIVLEELLKRSIKSSSEIALLFRQEFHPDHFAQRCALGTKKHISDIDRKIGDVKFQCDKIGLNFHPFIEDAELMKDLFSRYAAIDNDLDDTRSKKMLARNIVYGLAFNFMGDTSPILIPNRFRSLLRHLDFHNAIDEFQNLHESNKTQTGDSESSKHLRQNSTSRQRNRIPQGHGAFPLRKFWGNLKTVLDYHLRHHLQPSSYGMFSKDSSLEAVAFELSHNRGALQNWVRASNAVNRRHTYLYTAGVLESLVGRTRGRSILQLPVRLSPESIREIIAITCETPSNSFELQRRLNEIDSRESESMNDKSNSQKDRRTKIERQLERNKRRAQDSSVPLRLAVTPLTSIQLRNAESMFRLRAESDAVEKFL